VEYRNVGQTGLKVSTVSIGGWLTIGGTVGGRPALDILHTAVDNGINFIDLADIYARGKAEQESGAFLTEYVAGAGRERSDLVISSKVFWPMSDNPNDRGLSRKHIMESCEKSLRRLGTDYLDIYFCHRWDDATPLEETARAMDDLIRQGKILYWGTSVWQASQLESAHALAERKNLYPPIVEQPRYNLIDRHIESCILPAGRNLGMGFVVWSPLAQGLLTGKYNDGIPSGTRGATTDWLKEHLTEANIDRVRQLGGIASELGVSTGQLSLAWLLHQPGVTSVITGATRPTHVTDNVAAAALKLAPEVCDRISALFAA